MFVRTTPLAYQRKDKVMYHSFRNIVANVARWVDAWLRKVTAAILHHTEQCRAPVKVYRLVVTGGFIYGRVNKGIRGL